MYQKAIRELEEFFGRATGKDGERAEQQNIHGNASACHDEGKI